MAQNNSTEEMEMFSQSPVVVRVKMAIVQLLVWFLIYINIFMLFTFFSKHDFRGNARYILFAHTLLMDLIYLLLTNLMVLLTSFSVVFSMSACVLLCGIMETAAACTPLTITAMCLERYVAICMPLRHAAISTIGRTLAVIVIITAYSSLNPFVDLIILIFNSAPGYFAKLTMCHTEIIIVADWNRSMKLAWGQVDVAVIVIIIFVFLFCYINIMLVARNASGENKQSVSKGRRTLLLHGLQIFLSMVDMCSAYTQNLALEHSVQLFLTVRYFSFVALGIISRALSSIIYGLRDEKFLLALKSYATCRVNRNIGNKQRF